MTENNAQQGKNNKAENNKVVAFIDGMRWKSLAGIAAVCYLVIIATIVITTNESNPGFKDNAAILAFITGLAVAIERIQEGVWTLFGRKFSTYWPMSEVSKQVNGMVDNLDKALQPFHQDLMAQLEQLDTADPDLDQAREEIKRMRDQFNALMQFAPDQQRLRLLAAAASQNVDYLSKKYGALLQPSVRAANAAIDGLQEFVATFKDNPGRRLISLNFGVLLGLAVAGLFGLDLFQAVLTTEAEGIMLYVRVIATGVIIGLGASPTHEVIRAVQEYKENKKGTNAMEPDLGSPQNGRLVWFSGLSRGSETIRNARSRSVQDD